MRIKLNISTSFSREIKKLLSELMGENFDYQDISTELSMNSLNDTTKENSIVFLINDQFENLVKNIEFFIYREKFSQFQIEVDSTSHTILVIENNHFKIYFKSL